MTSIDTLLKHAAPEAVDPEPGVVDADLARGRAALVTARRRRTHRRMAAGAASLAAVGIAGVVIGTSGSSRSGDAATHPAPSARLDITTRAHAHARTTRHVPRIELVDYRGPQLAGFTVDQVPQGWTLSTSTPTALLITPQGSTDNDPDAFAGKLAVLTSSTDEHGGLPGGRPVTVDGQPGTTEIQGDVQMLRYNAPNGFGIDIQAPTSLHWTDQQIAAFAQGVHVTSHAVHTHG